jgi:hypothetical protein
VIKSGYQDKEKSIQKKGCEKWKAPSPTLLQNWEGSSLRRFRKVSFAVTFM